MDENYRVKQEFGPFPSTALSKNHVKQNRINREQSVLGWAQISTDNYLLQIAVFVQFWAMFSDSSAWLQLIYIRNVIIGLSFLCSCIQILDFLSFHHLFGPWAIIIR